MKICELDFPENFFEKHYKKRFEEGVIKDKRHYVEIIKDTIKNASRYFIVRQFSDCKDKLVFYLNKWSVWVLMEEKRIITAFYLRCTTIEEFFEVRNIQYGLSADCEKETYLEVKKNEDNRYSRFIKAIQDRC